MKKITLLNIPKKISKKHFKRKVMFATIKNYLKNAATGNRTRA